MINMTKNSEKFYDQLAFAYPIVDCFLKPQKDKFFRQINDLPPGQLLEIGVGNGANLKYYKNDGIVGIDTSKRMLAVAQKHAKGNIRLFQMNGENMLFPDESFDYVVLS